MLSLDLHEPYRLAGLVAAKDNQICLNTGEWGEGALRQRDHTLKPKLIDQQTAQFYVTTASEERTVRQHDDRASTRPQMLHYMLEEETLGITSRNVEMRIKIVPFPAPAPRWRCEYTIESFGRSISRSGSFEGISQLETWPTDSCK